MVESYFRSNTRGGFLKISLILFGFLFAVSAMAENFRGFVKIHEGQELFVIWNKAAVGKPTVVLLNGLTYTTAQWTAMTQALTVLGVGVVRYDMEGMGQTLIRDGFPLAIIPIKNQVSDLKELLVALKIPTPYNLVGLSYGGGMGIAFAEEYPEDIGALVAMAPYTKPIQGQDEAIRKQIKQTRITFPLNPATDDELYDYFLKQMVYLTYPSAEPIILEHPWKLEAVFRMAQGIRKWNALGALDKMPNANFHLMIADEDQYVARETMDELWDLLPVEKRGSLMVIEETEHKVPEFAPNFAAAWVYKVLTSKELFHTGVEFTGSPYTGTVTYDGGSFQLLKGE